MTTPNPVLVIRGVWTVAEQDCDAISPWPHDGLDLAKLTSSPELTPPCPRGINTPRLIRTLRANELGVDEASSNARLAARTVGSSWLQHLIRHPSQRMVSTLPYLRDLDDHAPRSPHHSGLSPPFTCTERLPSATMQPPTSVAKGSSFSALFPARGVWRESGYASSPAAGSVWGLPGPRQAGGSRGHRICAT